MQPRTEVHVTLLQAGDPSQWMHSDAALSVSNVVLLQASCPMQRIWQMDVPQLIVSELHTLLPWQVTRQVRASPHVTVSQSFCWVQLTSQRATPGGQVGV